MQFLQDSLLTKSAVGRKMLMASSRTNLYKNTVMQKIGNPNFTRFSSYKECCYFDPSLTNLYKKPQGKIKECCFSQILL